MASEEEAEASRTGLSFRSVEECLRDERSNRNNEEDDGYMTWKGKDCSLKWSKYGIVSPSFPTDSKAKFDQDTFLGKNEINLDEIEARFRERFGSDCHEVELHAPVLPWESDENPNDPKSSQDLGKSS